MRQIPKAKRSKKLIKIVLFKHLLLEVLFRCFPLSCFIPCVKITSLVNVYLRFKLLTFNLRQHFYVAWYWPFAQIIQNVGHHVKVETPQNCQAEPLADTRTMWIHRNYCISLLYVVVPTSISFWYRLHVYVTQSLSFAFQYNLPIKVFIVASH